MGRGVSSYFRRLNCGDYTSDVDGGVYLIEEPENGIHPRAVETVFQALSSVYRAQVLLATHSPVILGMADLDSLLCFARDSEGATDVVAGSGHPSLKHWMGAMDLSSLFAERDLWPTELSKPPDPKAAMEAILRVRHIPRSLSLYRELARKVGLKSCQDEAFQHLRDVLQHWFPPGDPY